MTARPLERPPSRAPLFGTVRTANRGGSTLGAWGVAAVLGGFASWYGYLEAAEGHPSLKLGSAMALAGIGTATLLLVKPAGPEPGDGLYEHSALVSVHPVRLAAAWLSMGASLVHFAVIQQHLEEYWLYGAFFIVVAIAQLAWALLVLTQPSRPLLLAGAVGNSLVVATWIVTRTFGTLVGPQATTPALAGFGDIVSTVFEVLIILGSIALLTSRHFDDALPAHRGEVINALGAIGLTLLVVLALYSSVGGSPFVTPVG